MCQCLICGCCWWNYCGVCCGGIHEAACVCSYWLCKPDDLRLIDPECCHVCACDGYGYNCLYYGIICCAPRAVQEWSGLRAAGKTAADLNKQTIIINNTSPVYMMPNNMEMGYMQQNQNMGNMGMYAGNPNYNNTAMGMNVNAGGMGMNVYANSNSGPQGVNAKINF